MIKTIEKIKLASRHCAEEYLDEELREDGELGFTVFFNLQSCKFLCRDVEVKNIKTVIHRNLCKESGATWRTAVEKLHGSDWNDSVFDYFLRPLNGRKFPSESSAETMVLSKYGELYHVANGVHRVIAGKAWLARIYGPRAKFLECEVKEFSISKTAKEFLSAHLSCSLKVYDTRSSIYNRIYVDGEVVWAVVKVLGKPLGLYVAYGDQGDVVYLWKLKPRYWYEILVAVGSGFFSRKSRGVISPEIVRLLIS